MHKIITLCEAISPIAVVEPDQLDGYAKIEFPVLYRGVEGGTDARKAIRYFADGDMGSGVYLTPDEQVASTYGGGPRASVLHGTRVVHAYRIKRAFYPEEVIFMFGGRTIGGSVTLVSGNGITLWSGPWKGAQIEAALMQQDAKIVVGTTNSIGRKQVCVRDFSLLTEIPVETGPTAPRRERAPARSRGD